MRLVSLRLRNFLSHRETKVEFPETGIILISGENAMGKSSLFDALRFALFGRNFQKPRELVTKGAKDFSVEAVFTHRGHEYRVTREYAATKKELKPTRAEIVKDGRPAAAGGVADLDSFIVHELGVNHEMFRYSVMAVQGEIMGVLGLSSSERRAVFERMFGYHHLRLVAEAAASLAAEEEKELSGLFRATGYAVPEELERDIGEKKKALAEQEGLLSALASEKEGLGAEEERLAREAREIEDEEKAVKEMETERAALAREIRVREEEIARLKNWREEQGRRTGELPRLRESLKALEGTLAELSALREEEGVVATQEKKAADVRALEKSLEEITGYEKTLKELLPSHERSSRLREEEKNIQAGLERLKEQLGETNELLKTLSKETKEKEELERKLGALPEIKESRKEILARIEEKESEARKTEAERGAADERAKRAQKDIVAMEKLGDTCPLCKQKLTPEHRAGAIERLRAESGEAMKLAEELAARSKALKDEIATLAGLARDAEQKERLEERLSGLLAREREARERLEKMAGAREEHEALRRRMDELREEIKQLEPAERRFTAAEDFLARNPRQELESALSRAREEVEKLGEKRRFPGMGSDEIRARIKSLLPGEREAVKIASEIENLERLALEVEKQESLLEEKRAGLAEKMARLESLAGTDARRSSLEERRKAHREAREKLQARKDSLNEKEVSLRKDLEVMAKELAGLSGLLETAERSRERVNLFSEVKRRLLSPQGIEREFVVAMRRLEDNLNACFQDFSFSGLQAVHLDEELAPVKVDEMGRQMERLSGGEQVAMGIAMRFAIARALLGTESESLFLDEPTHNLDSERISSLQDLLVQFKLHPAAPQVVIITHDEDMKVVADTVIGVVKEDGVSRILNSEN